MSDEFKGFVKKKYFYLFSFLDANELDQRPTPRD